LAGPGKPQLHGADSKLRVTELRVEKEPTARLLRRRACGKTAAQKSAARKKEQCTCYFPMGMPAKLSMNRLAQASFDKRFGLSFGKVISEQCAVWHIKVGRQQRGACENLGGYPIEF
jgi:hypothetical protein